LKIPCGRQRRFAFSPKIHFVCILSKVSFAGKEMYGADEWEKMQAEGQEWQDFLCANQSRNLRFDAFSRRFTDYVKGAFGNGLYAAKEKSGGRLRVEPDGEAFVRSICKLMHVGAKQY
jgi:hypothetical protein